MQRTVLDVNVIVSGFASPGGAPRILIERWLRRHFELVTSEHILNGVERAWRNPYFRDRYDEHQAGHALALIRERATIVAPVHALFGFADDEEDDLVLATAVTGNASMLVTGDKGLLKLVDHEGILIVSPREYLEMIARNLS
jgi:putative PIN family toxin of toxin-antitoxin system